LENTLVWFMSDNGGLKPGSSPPGVEKVFARLTDWFGKPLPLDSLEFVRSNLQDGGSDNGPYRRGKSSVYEGGVRVPSVVSWPGTLQPRRVDSRITVQDVLPTLAQVAGLTLAQDHVPDGGNQWPTFSTGKPTSTPDYVTVGFDGEAYYRDNWKLLVLRGEDPELYDLQADPTEAVNLADSMPDLTRELASALAAFPRGESIHQNSFIKIALDPDAFGGAEDREPWADMVRD
jgi:arylsulfatase A-like enzyme